MSGTPLMQQYREIKARHQDAILLFRMGDFYEMFYEDAHVASRVLGLTLTSRNNGGAADVPLAGVPAKAVHDYLRRLVQGGFRVAICEQVEDPKHAKGVVRREVVETVTPGAAFDDELLDAGRNNYLCAIHLLGSMLGVAAADMSTGAFRLSLTASGDGEAVIARYAPNEILVARGSAVLGSTGLASPDGALVTERDPWEFDPVLAREDLARQFGVRDLEGFGLGVDTEAAIGAGGALLRYLRELQPAGIPHLAQPQLQRDTQVMPLDEMTRRNLELTESLRNSQDLGGNHRAGERTGTLLGVLDCTRTPMGARLLRQWLLAPLLDLTAINDRLDAVARCVEQSTTRRQLREALDGVRDVERLSSKVAAGRSGPREVRGLGDSLARLAQVGAVAASLGEAGVLTDVNRKWDNAADLAADICRTLTDRPPPVLGDEDAIAAGVDDQLDELRRLRDGGKDAIARIQADERARTGIASLKVGYNRVFGYYIEITNANRHLIPEDYQRRQTLTGAERYVTPSLKDYEERILTASERIAERERELFDALRKRVGGEIKRLQAIGQRSALLDVVSALAELAEVEQYVRPIMSDEFELNIEGSRHPVVERMMPREKFIPNDVRLTEDARVIVLTGPNMAGKSTILRQVGLICVMAQMGSFVPASHATVGVVDRLFTRVGASDNLVRGQSTFMVEMAETSAILHGATRRSLVLLDEIGRGTSTYDGVSIAWAVTEHLHHAVGCKTIFATHYHELTQLASDLRAVRNYNVAVQEVGGAVLFLHKLQPGGADRSYGIEVGRLAGLPDAVITRARVVLSELEGEGAHLAAALETNWPATGRSHPDARIQSHGPQLGLFTSATHPVIERLRHTQPNHMTPLDALLLIDELARLARES